MLLKSYLAEGIMMFEPLRLFENFFFCGERQNKKIDRCFSHKGHEEIIGIFDSFVNLVPLCETTLFMLL